MCLVLGPYVIGPDIMLWKGLVNVLQLLLLRLIKTCSFVTYTEENNTNKTVQINNKTDMFCTKPTSKVND